MPGGTSGGIRPAPGGERYTATNVSAKLMATVALRLRDETIGGGPDWFGGEPGTCPLKRNVLPAWKTCTPCCGICWWSGSVCSMQPHNALSAGNPWIDNKVEQVNTTMHATAAPMDFLAWRLSLAMDRPVIDLTGLKGGYDFDLTFSKEQPSNVPEGAVLYGAKLDTSNSTIADAMRRQLGLRLDKQDGMVDFLVIDHAERPGAN